MGRGAGGRARDRRRRRPALRPDGAAQGSGRAGLHVLLQLRVAQGARARGEPARCAALPPQRDPGARRGPGAAHAGARSRTRTGRHARPRRAAAPPPRGSPSRSPRARRSRKRSPRSPTSHRGRRTGAATGSSRSRTSSGATVTTGCTNVTCSGDAATSGRCYFSNREGGFSRRPRSRARARRRRCSSARVAHARRLSRVPVHEPVERACRHAAGRTRLGGADRVDRPRLARPRRLRLGALGRLAHRHPVRRRAREEDAQVARHFRLRGRERQGAVPDPGQRADRGPACEYRRRPARAHPRPRHLPAVRALRAPSAGRAVGGRFGRDLEPALERSPPCRLDVRRRGRPADPPRPRPLGRRRLHRRDQPRAPLHRRPHAQGLPLAGAALRVERLQRVVAADGAARPSQGERGHQQAAAPGAPRRDRR